MKEDSKATAAAKKETKLGVAASKDADLSAWYQQVLLKAEMIEYYDVSGCYILRPWSFKIWDTLKRFLTAEFEALGVQEAYFPLFIPQSALNKEKDHIEGFAPEVAWVTKSGSSDLPEPIAVRPTSETIMYPSYAKWIQSHRDMPLKLNQWCNVVRWEFKHPQPFLRSREFLWQEGHTAFATKQEADTEVRQILELYRRAYEEYLAVPVVPGIKTEKEKFAGGLYTTTVEAFIPAAGRGIQGATSHCLGQNFSKMFDIKVESASGEAGQHEFVWQNSWGFTTRSIGVMTLVHADDTGLVLPPRVAGYQVVIVPVGVTARTSEEEKARIMAAVDRIAADLRAAGVRVHCDCRDNYTPGWKFNDWEMKGVPVRVEVGPRDLAEQQVRVALRWNGSKMQLPIDGLSTRMPLLLNEIHDGMFAKAKAQRDAQLRTVQTFDEFCQALDAKCIVLAPWCKHSECEDQIKERSKGTADADAKAPSMGAKSLCMPFEQPTLAPGTVCVQCGKPAQTYCLFGRSY